MSRRRRIVFWSALSLLALLVIAISWLLTADLGRFKPQIEHWASEKTGRQVAINGALKINLARRSSIVVEDVHIGNPAWAQGTEMLSVGRLEVHFDLLSVFRGALLVQLVDLDDTRLALIESERGEQNWILSQQDAAPGDEPRARGKGVLLAQIDVDQLQIVYSSPRREQDIDLVIEHFSQQRREDDFLELALNGTINGRAAQLDGEVGSWAALLEKKNVRFDLDARLDTFEFSGEGYIDDLLRPYRPALRFKATAPDINDLLRVLGVAEEGSGAIDLSGSLSAEEQRPLQLDVQGQLGRVSIEGNGRFSNFRELEEIDIDLLAAGDDVRPILAALGIRQAREAPFMVNIDARRNGRSLVIDKADMLFGDARFGLTAQLPNFPDIDNGIVKLKVDGPDIERFRGVFNLPGAASGPFALGFTIDVSDDGVEIVNLELQSSLLRLQANGDLGDPPTYFGSRLEFRGASDSLQTTASAYGIEHLPDQAAEIEGGIEYGADGIRIRKPLLARSGGLVVRADGLIKPVRGALGSDLQFEVSGPDLAAEIGAFVAADQVPAQPFRLGGQLQLRKDGYRFLKVDGNVGSSAIELDGLLVVNGGIAGSHFDFAVSGAAFEELLAQLGDIEVLPGPFDLGGEIRFSPDMIGLRNFRLHRAGGDVDLDFAFGLPASRRWADFELHARGPDVRSMLRGVRRFAADEAPFSVALRGERRGTHWAFSQLQLGVGAALLSASGDLDLDGKASASQFELRIDVPNVATLGTLDGRRPLEQALAVQARGRGHGGVLEIDDMIATLGASAIKADLRYQAGVIPEVFVDVDANSVVFVPWFEAPDEQPAAPIEIADGRLIPDIAIPFPALARFNAEFELDINALQREVLRLHDISVRGSLRDGVLDLTGLGFKARSGALAAQARLAPEQGSGSAALQIVARDFAPGMLSLNQDLGMRGDVDIKLSATGNDLRSMLGSANGVAFVNTRGGRIVDNKFLKRLYGDMIDQLLSAINPFQKSESHTDFECVIIPLEIVDGTLKTSPRSLVSTDKIRVLSDSVIDLETEKIAINIRTTPKKGITISAGEIVNPYLKVVGTLAAPRLAVDEKGVLVSGGVAVATGGLSILARAAWDRLSRSDDACDEAAKDGRKALGDRLPTLEPATS